MIWQRVRWAAVVGVVGILLKTVPVQTRLSRYTAALRMKVARRTDGRVSVMNEIINGIQVIKMYAWEIPFQKVVAEARRLEIKQIRYSAYIHGCNISSFVFIESKFNVNLFSTGQYFEKSFFSNDIFRINAFHFNRNMYFYWTKYYG